MNRTSPPQSYRRVPVRELRVLPIRENHRLQVLDYRLTLAPGMTGGGKPRTHGHGAARLTGGYIMALCVTQDSGEWFLETEITAYDEARERRDALNCSAQLLADLYRAVQRRQIAAEGRAYGRGKGRN